MNQRSVAVEEIQSETAQPVTEFEAATFQFIRDWLDNRETLTLQTSGSTGNPSSIAITRKQMQQSARRTIRVLGLAEAHTALVCLNTKYIAGKMMLVRALEAKMKIIATEPTSDPFKKLDISSAPDFMAVAPLQLQSLIATPTYQKKLNRMKAILVGGAAVSENLKKEIQSLSCPVYATYGMTETISHIALRLLTTGQQKSNYQILPGVKISTDKRGCLIIHDEIIGHPIVTNDLVNLKNSNSFEWLGRYDNIINSGGIKISPEKVEMEIDRIAASISLTRNFFIAGLPHPSLGEQVVLFIEGTPIGEPLEKRILENASRQLPEFENPKQIKYISKFSFTPTGKINRGKTLAGVKDQ